MTEVVYYAAISLDGFIARNDGDVDWLNKYIAAGEDYGFTAFNESIDAILMGRLTYEKSLELGPMPTGSKPVWVFSSRSGSDDNPSLKFVSLSPQQAVAELSNQGYKRVWLMGGGKLAASFLSADLIQEYDLAVMPELLGEGIPLIQPVDSQTELELVDHTIHPSGVVQLRYRKTSQYTGL